MTSVDLRQGDCLDVLRDLPDNSVDAVVCDPPYGLSNTKPQQVADVLKAWVTGDDEQVPEGKGFMGKTWDGFVPPPAVWKECLRVLKPGGHMAVFAGARTQDLMGLSIRLAGFEIRDTLGWIYGSGFPKSQNVHKVSLNRVTSRYGTSRCNCMDTGDGRRSRHEFGQEGGGLVGTPRGQSQVPPPETRDTDLPINTSTPGDDVCELRGGDTSQTKGSSEVPETVLLPDMRTRGTETSGHGHAEVRAGVEEQEGRGQAAGHEVPILRDHAGGERERTTRASSSPLPVRGDQPPGESGGPVQLVPPRDRGGDQPSVGHDPGRREPRRVSPDGEGRRGDTVARVCSWCGLPDPEWLRSLEGLGSALKPAIEPIILARKPLDGTVAGNVLAHGVGGLNIDASRVGTDGGTRKGTFPKGKSEGIYGDGINGACEIQDIGAGRFPANVLLDEHAAAEMDKQSGVLKSGDATIGAGKGRADNPSSIASTGKIASVYADQGGASRFFPVFKYQAKAPKRERPIIEREDGTKVQHPTVKPVALMEWLVTLITPPGGTVLDPFAGSGTTLEAARNKNFHAIGIEREPDYCELIHHRLNTPTLT